ncbi:alpha/beta hydrolase [Staphylococcus croceilyticus]|uniref:Alpha/beta hydrolase n=1 Tax=Staphylococcus croceilyticus TaxID=319942 RepID=A0ABY2KBW0_9STAP|nr:alpha/beta hydrolase [Staphylococcus croceilyticus]PNZ69089.1 alpha/beta hydrolase [Staphylococcus croceilyticus]TGA77604.1 alpha/beta hydrolase [Staphylococcus croceilyticus]
MTKRKMIYFIFTLCILIVLVTGCSQSEKQHSHKSSALKDQTVTLFMHGYGGSENSEKYMVKQALNKDVTKDAIVATVDNQGKIHFKGTISNDAQNPIVKVVFEDNKNGDVNQNAKNIKNVLSELKAQYGFTKYNFVAHSMGNLSFAYFMKDYGNDKHLPQIQKEVNIAGTFNGVLNLNEKVNEISVDKNGKPSKMNDNYKELLGLEDIYKGKNIDVLNIYGDLQDGTHSDGRVSNSSSKSLKYLLQDSPKSYKETKYTGKSAQHSELHENKEVANEIIKFLWNK